MSAGQLRVLPRELLETQINQLDLLLAMYSGEGELQMDPANRDLYTNLKSSIENHQSISQSQLKPYINIHVSVAIDSQDKQVSVLLNIGIPILLEAGQDFEHDLVPRVSLNRPSWLTRRTFDGLVDGMPNKTEDCVVDAIEYLQRELPAVMKESQVAEPYIPDLSPKPIARVWFYFPSLSTREKRHDLVNLAPLYDLTGFVLAGKPGVLCLEGVSDDVQSYIADIKRNSWGDIPSFQKKITERFRESEQVSRKFRAMQEITDDIERHGQRGNRGNLAQVEEFLKNVGLGEAFSKVFMQCDR